MAEDIVDVLIIGAGPVGLGTALALREEGVGVRVIDMFRRSSLHSYALALHPSVLDLLADHVEDELAAIGVGNRMVEVSPGFEITSFDG